MEGEDEVEKKRDRRSKRRGRRWRTKGYGRVSSGKHVDRAALHPLLISPVRQTTTQSTSQSVSQLRNPPVHQPVGQPVNHPESQSQSSLNPSPPAGHSSHRSNNQSLTHQQVIHTATQSKSQSGSFLKTLSPPLTSQPLTHPAS